MSTPMPFSVLVRTLLAAGYEIKDAFRQPNHLELFAQRIDELDVPVSYLIAVTDAAFYSESQLAELRTAASDSQSQLVTVASNGGPSNFSIDELLDRLGGPIPSWRALSDDYSAGLMQLSRNELPSGEIGEAWRLFEDAVNDGLEFLFGRRVNRLGGSKRGTRVADSICKTRDDAIILVDAKAASGGFDAANESLRALKEYAQLQRRMQQGQQPLSSCLIVSSEFIQQPSRLQEIGGDFMVEAGVPIAFLTSSQLGRMVELVSARAIRQRGAIGWKKVFGVIGAIQLDRLERELVRIEQLQMTRE